MGDEFDGVVRPPTRMLTNRMTTRVKAYSVLAT
jgi:hypothetical protein